MATVVKGRSLAPKIWTMVLLVVAYSVGLFFFLQWFLSPQNLKTKPKPVPVTVSTLRADTSTLIIDDAAAMSGSKKALTLAKKELTVALAAEAKLSKAKGASTYVKAIGYLKTVIANPTSSAATAYLEKAAKLLA